MDSRNAFVRPDVRTYLEAIAAQQAPDLREGGIGRLRSGYAASKTRAELPLGETCAGRDVSIPDPAGVIPARLFEPRSTPTPGPLVLFFHGGGFVIGDLDTHASLCATIASALGLPVLSIAYRLAPEDPWPAAPDDAEAAARWAAGSPPALGLDVTAIVLSGDSAGGNLAIVTATALRDAPAEANVSAQILMYPLIDPTPSGPLVDEFADGYLLTRGSLAYSGSAYRADPEHVRAVPTLGRLAGLPPTVVVTASLDPLRDQGRSYAAALATAGVPVIFREAVGNIHGFATLRRAIPSSVEDVDAALNAAKLLLAHADRLFSADRP